MSDVVASMLEGWRSDLQGKPRPGFYRARLKAHCPWVPARIWLEPARDDEGRKADRPDRLVCQVMGLWWNPYEIWPRCHEITESEYVELCRNPPRDPFEWTASRRNRTKSLRAPRSA